MCATMCRAVRARRLPLAASGASCVSRMRTNASSAATKKALNNTNSATAEIKALLKENEWNKYRVLCQGDRIQAWVNGVQVTDLRDSMTQTGFIGLQVHGVGKRSDALHVQWRNLRLRELK